MFEKNVLRRNFEQEASDNFKYIALMRNFLMCKPKCPDRSRVHPASDSNGIAGPFSGG
jgi:hypothetical protein